jgi:hypothetical protein
LLAEFLCLLLPVFGTVIILSPDAPHVEVNVLVGLSGGTYVRAFHNPLFIDFTIVATPSAGDQGKGHQEYQKQC